MLPVSARRCGQPCKVGTRAGFRKKADTRSLLRSEFWERISLSARVSRRAESLDRQFQYQSCSRAYGFPRLPTLGRFSIDAGDRRLIRKVRTTADTPTRSPITLDLKDWDSRQSNRESPVTWDRLGGSNRPP